MLPPPPLCKGRWIGIYAETEGLFCYRLYNNFHLQSSVILTDDSSRRTVGPRNEYTRFGELRRKGALKTEVSHITVRSSHILCKKISPVGVKRRRAFSRYVSRETFSTDVSRETFFTQTYVSIRRKSNPQIDRIRSNTSEY